MAALILNPDELMFEGYMTHTLGIANLAVRNSLRAQGLGTVHDFISLTEGDIEDICKIIRRPGGTIPNPAFGRGGRNAIPVPEHLPNPGIQIGHLHEKRLKMLRYYTFHLQRVQRNFDPNVATMQVLQEIYLLKEVNDEDLKPALPEKLTKTDKVREVIENIESVLLTMKGINGVPLLYVVRDLVALPTGIGDDIDPGFGLPTYTQEMIRRAPHTGVYFREAQKSVWGIIRHVTHGGPGWNWVQSFASTQDGRNAFLSMKRYYLGESYTRRIKLSAENTLSTAFYNGQVRTFKFGDYVDKLKGAFTDIESSGEVIDPQRKIRILMQGLSDARLKTGKATVLANPHLYNDFESVVNFFTTVLNEEESMAVATKSHQRNVSAIRTSNNNRNETRAPRGGGRAGRGGGRGRGGRFGRGGRHHAGRNNTSNVSDRSYTKEEWLALSSEDRQKVRDLRAKRNRDMNSSSMTTDRNVIQRVEYIDVTDASTGDTASNRSMSVSGITATSNSTTESSGIGSQMSQRSTSRNRNNNL
jgi:hypothetical protein